MDVRLETFGLRLVRGLGSMGAVTDGIFAEPGRHTTTKTRIMAGDLHTSKQQVIRIDRDSGAGIGEETEERILEYIERIRPGVDAWFVSDYGYGLVTPRIRERLKVLQLAAAEFSSLMMVALAYALLAEVLGLHWILGAFMAGIFFEPERVGVRAYNEMRIITVGITGGFLGPLFFASIGLEIDYSAVLAAPLLVAGLIIIGSGAKFFGAAIPARLTGFPRSEAAVVGRKLGADLVLIGASASRATMNTMGENIKSFKGTASVRAVRTDTPVEIASTTQSAIASRR